MKPPHGYAEIVKVYGDPKMLANRVDAAWERSSMVLARDLPCGVAKLYVHRLVEAPLRAALARCEALGWRPTTIGCFSPRAKRGSGDLSVHTWGAAVDIDAATNPLELSCPSGDIRRSSWRARPDRIPDGVIAAFKAENWTWGGDFRSRFDPMHFQFCTGY